MDIFTRTIAVIIEVLILAGIAYSILAGVRLAALDLGVGSRYGKILAAIMIFIGTVVVVFFIAHLTSFYPGARGL